MSDPVAPTPERILQTINAFQNSAALRGAVELGLFTALGSEYTFNEYESMFSAAGFAKSELHRLHGPPQSVIVSTK